MLLFMLCYAIHSVPAQTVFSVWLLATHLKQCLYVLVEGECNVCRANPLTRQSIQQWDLKLGIAWALVQQHSLLDSFYHILYWEENVILSHLAVRLMGTRSDNHMQLVHTSLVHLLLH